MLYKTNNNNNVNCRFAIVIYFNMLWIYTWRCFVCHLYFRSTYIIILSTYTDVKRQNIFAQVLRNGRLSLVYFVFFFHLRYAQLQNAGSARGSTMTCTMNDQNTHTCRRIFFTGRAKLIINMLFVERPKVSIGSNTVDIIEKSNTGN